MNSRGCRHLLYGIVQHGCGLARISLQGSSEDMQSRNRGLQRVRHAVLEFLKQYSLPLVCLGKIKRKSLQRNDDGDVECAGQCPSDWQKIMSGGRKKYNPAAIDSSRTNTASFHPSSRAAMRMAG